jgi:endonuclease G, mitochondrial
MNVEVYLYLCIQNCIAAIKFRKNGFMSGRTKFLVFLAFLGVFLYYKGKADPIGSLKKDVYNIFGIKSDSKNKEYNTPPIVSEDNEATATNDRKSNKEDSKKEETEASAKEEKPGGIFGDILDKISEKKTDTENDEGSSQGDSQGSLEYYLPKERKGQLVRHSALILNYQEEHEQASWVLHKLLSKTNKGSAKRSNEFMPDPLVETGSALPSDYSRSGYDKGHLCPAGDFKHDKTLQDETFYMSNMSPQVGDFNRGIWNDFEMLVRRWAGRRGDLIVITGPVLKNGLETIGRRNSVSVPEQYYKIVYDPQTEQALAILMPNEGLFDRRIREFVVSIDEVERLTGIDFFEKLPDALEKKIETNANESQWWKN